MVPQSLSVTHQPPAFVPGSMATQSLLQPAVTTSAIHNPGDVILLERTIFFTHLKLQKAGRGDNSIAIDKYLPMDRYSNEKLSGETKIMKRRH